MSTMAGAGFKRAGDAQHVKPGGAGQVLVGEHQIEAALVHEVDGLLGRGGGGDAVAAAPERLAQHGQHHRLVVDHQHLVAGGDDRRVRARRGGVGDQARVDVARRRRVARALGAGQHAVARQRLDDPHPGRLAVPARRRGRGHPAQKLERRRAGR